MRRATYVGPTETYPWSWPQRHPLHYGMTGDCREGATFWSFRPDGEVYGKFVRREDLQILPEDLTNYYPKLT